MRLLALLRPLLAAALLGAALPGHAGSGTLGVSVVVLSKSTCKFTGSTNVTMNFSAINPAATSDAVATVNFTIRCGGSAPNATFALAAGDGAFASGPGAQRMRHASVSTEFIPYSLSFSPASATIPKNTDQNIAVTGRITPTAMQNALVGTYFDVVAITVQP